MLNWATENVDAGTITILTEKFIKDTPGKTENV